VIAVVTCYQGLAQPLRIEEVSGATTRAVVQSVVACVLLDARYSLNGAAAFRRRHWYERIHGHCARMLGALEARVRQAEET
jgi:hypothetical protein